MVKHFVLFVTLSYCGFSMAEQTRKDDLSLRAGMLFPKYFYFTEGMGSGISNINYKADKGLFLELSRPVYKGLETIAGLQVLSQKFDVKTYQRYYYDPIRIEHSVRLYVVNIGLSQAVVNKKYLKLNVMAGLMPTRIRDHQTKVYTDSGYAVNKYNRYTNQEKESSLLTWYVGVELKKKIVNELYGMLQSHLVFQTISNSQTQLYTINRFNLNLGLIYNFIKK